MKKENAVVTLVDGPVFEQIHAVTKPSQLAYARRIGAKYVTLRATAGWSKEISKHWVKMNLFQKLEEYERIIFLDCDTIVHPECPNLFDVVPITHLGAFVEGTVDGRGPALMKALKDYNITSERPYLGEYFNSGVMVLSAVHQGLFWMPKEIHNNFWEQSLLNARAFASYLPLCDIGYKFNRMQLLDNITGESRHASWIIHYAGLCGHLKKDEAEREVPLIIDTIKDDLRAWEEKRPVVRNILVECSGGLGDVICAEPVLRYAIEELYADDPTARFTILTDKQRVFSHFGRYKNVEVTNGGSMEGFVKPTLQEYAVRKFGVTAPVARWFTHPPTDHVTRIYYPYSSIHNLDFGMVTMLRDAIPISKKRIRLEVEYNDCVELDERLGSSFEPGRAVAIHPGVGWPSKTFPIPYWNAIIKGLIDAEFTPVVFGGPVVKQLTASHQTGTLDVAIPPGAYDLRGMLSMGAYFALIQNCPYLLTNDSSPVHVAGAFDNWIIMIATCKRPELVFPYRNDSVLWKTRAVVGKLTRDGLKNLPTTPKVRPMSDVEGLVEEYLPTPEQVIEAVKECALACG